MEKKIKVAVVKVRTVEMQKSYATADNDIFPCFATATTRFKVYLSDDIAKDMSVAQAALKGITGKTKSETLELTASGPAVDLDDSKTISRERSSQAVVLLSAALPQYEFSVAEGTDELHYEIAAPVGSENGTTDLVSARIKAMECILVAFVLTCIIPYWSIPWASYVVAAFYAMFGATILYCLVTWLVARIVKADKISVSIGIIPKLCLYRFKTADIHCGPIPLPDLALSASIMNKPLKSWTIGVLPAILMTLVGCVFVSLRDYLFTTSPDTVIGFMPCHIYSLAAIFALSCVVTSVVSLLLFFEKSRDLYPHLAIMFIFLEYALALAAFLLLYHYSLPLLHFITP